MGLWQEYFLRSNDDLARYFRTFPVQKTHITFLLFQQFYKLSCVANLLSVANSSALRNLESVKKSKIAFSTNIIFANLWFGIFNLTLIISTSPSFRDFWTPSSPKNSSVSHFSVSSPFRRPISPINYGKPVSQSFVGIFYILGFLLLF